MKIVSITLALLILISTPINAIHIDNSFYDKNLYSYPKEKLERLVTQYRQVQENAYTLIESAKALKWDEDSEAIQMAWKELEIAQSAIDLYTERYCELVKIDAWNVRKKEYPVATEIWLYMKALGWNDNVCAGIMGNLMAEVGGGTLNIQYWLYGSGGYYGMCQWARIYCPTIWGANLQTQCNYLRDTIKSEINTFGFLYCKGFNFEKFLALQDCREAAIAFSKAYERNMAKYTNIRAIYAENAYNYFVD